MFYLFELLTTIKTNECSKNILQSLSMNFILKLIISSNSLYEIVILLSTMLHWKNRKPLDTVGIRTLIKSFGKCASPCDRNHLTPAVRFAHLFLLLLKS